MRHEPVEMHARRLQSIPVAFGIVLLGVSLSSAAERPFDVAEGLLERFCSDCHDGLDAEAGIDLEGMLAADSIAGDFRDWRKVLTMLSEGRMPPESAEQLSTDQSRMLLAAVREELDRVTQVHAGDPGPVVMRRLTSAEYDYTIRDLTGLDLNLADDFVSDAVGGEGFTNAGVAQFVQDSTLERWLEAARKVADHAVIGAGPLRFHNDPGQTGFELSAITRIQEIYRAHGFRRAAGEGGEAYGLERYPQAFFVAWQWQHRDQLGLADVPLDELAADEGVDARFVEYVSAIMAGDVESFPTSEIVAQWRALPVPETRDEDLQQTVRELCDDLFQQLHDWQIRFGINADAKEEAPVLAADSFSVSRTQPFEMNVNWPEGTRTAHLQFAVHPAAGDGTPNAVVVWRDPRILFRIPDEREPDPGPLRRVLPDDILDQLKFGVHPLGGTVARTDFVTRGTGVTRFRLPIPAGATSARLFVDAELDVEQGDDGIIRCTIAQEEETDQGKSVSALLANPDSPRFDEWKAGVLEFARLLPQISHREPAPSDRDPIPAPFDATYNNPERNHYHYRIKYHRDDRFLVENILDDATREELDQAWCDLLGSFEYHDAFLRFVADKYEVPLADRTIANLDPAWIESLPSEPREYVRDLFDSYHSIQQAFASAESGHVEDVLQFASRAWRRPLSDDDRNRLRSYYRTLREELDHRAAVRAMLTRVLVAPDFLYRIERTADEAAESAPLSDWELASRLSYFLWSSLPDDELRQAAEAGELSDPVGLARHALRMLGHPQSRRFSEEFFGQWFGFYRFDDYAGIDNARFPEFTDALKSAMHEEAVSFFDHVLRADRPVHEILTADYAFLNRELADHYGIPTERELTQDVVLVEGTDRHNRGGLLGMGALLTVTSAPLRTSPVRRGDWVLRRVLGTPVPPPPPDAGSISPDDRLGTGLSIREQLEAHRRESSCVNCHSRIDPLGFALEQFDAIGRWRDVYRDGSDIGTSGVLRDGSQINGLDGLHDYLNAQRRLFYENLCKKLVGYALGRGVLIGDMPLIAQMTADLEQDAGFSRLVEKIVTSRQFRYHGVAEQQPGETPAGAQ